MEKINIPLIGELTLNYEGTDENGYSRRRTEIVSGDLSYKLHGSRKSYFNLFHLFDGLIINYNNHSQVQQIPLQDLNNVQSINCNSGLRNF